MCSKLIHPSSWGINHFDETVNNPEKEPGFIFKNKIWQPGDASLWVKGISGGSRTGKRRA
jgi:hypothetical protein